jgi:hypothetical protein
MKNKILLFASICLITVACTTKTPPSNQSLYFNGDIITMQGDSPQLK